MLYLKNLRTSYAVKRQRQTSMELATLMKHPYLLLKVRTHVLLRNSVVTNLVINVAHTVIKKKNVSLPLRILTCNHCGTKWHIRLYCNKLRNSPNQKQWKKQKEESPVRNKLICVKKEDISSVFVHTLLKYLSMQVFVPKLHHPGSTRASPHPSADAKIILRGVKIEGELHDPDWQKLLEDTCLSIIDKKGEKNGARGRF